MNIQLGTKSVPYLNGILDIVDHYDGFLLDIWGVLHDSVKPYPGVIECLRRLKSESKKIILVSNAARRAARLQKELLAFGINGKMYDFIATSGELFWQKQRGGIDPALAGLGKNYYLIGSEKYNLTDGLRLRQSHELAGADFILTISVSGKTSSIADQEGVLESAAKLGLVMICVNPDVQVVRDGVLGIAPGAYARKYEELGGLTIYYGKPHGAIYKYCFELLPEIPAKRLVALGDSLNTDIAGASGFDLDSILVGTGIHSEAFKELPADPLKLNQICCQEKQYPTALVQGFQWQL